MVAKLEKMLGQRVAAYRKASRLTQERLAEQVHVAPETISRLERGVTVPSILTLAGIASALDVELGDFFRVREKKSAKDEALEALCRELKSREIREIEFVHEFAKRLFRFLPGRKK